MADTKKIEMSEEEIAFSEIIGDLVEQWGFNRNLGRIWSLLFLRNEPLNASDVQDALSLSAGSVSSGLTELQTWGCIKRLRVAADRNFYFAADENIWRSVGNVLRTRELRILEEARAGIDGLVHIIPKRNKGELGNFQVRRLKIVREDIHTALELFSNLLVGNPLGISKITKLVSRLRAR